MEIRRLSTETPWVVSPGKSVCITDRGLVSGFCVLALTIILHPTRITKFFSHKNIIFAKFVYSILNDWLIKLNT